MTMKKSDITVGTIHEERYRKQGRCKIGETGGRALRRHKQMERFDN
jgi:hypothetical protein